MKPRTGAEPARRAEEENFVSGKRQREGQDERRTRGDLVQHPVAGENMDIDEGDQVEVGLSVG